MKKGGIPTYQRHGSWRVQAVASVSQSVQRMWNPPLDIHAWDTVAAWKKDKREQEKAWGKARKSL